MTAAVALAPEFAIARFQLGFFELTSGEAEAARNTWLPLKTLLPHGHWMLLFVEGLESLILDRFAECISCLSEGIRHNQENLPLNNDMALIISQCRDLLEQDGQSENGEDGTDVSPTSFLLGSKRQH
jgi:hypothetical protein